MIFWKHIKGLSSDNIYTYIRFSEESAIASSILNTPSIYISDSGSYNDSNANQINLGHVLTSDMTDGFVTHDFTFKGDTLWAHSADLSDSLQLSYDDSNNVWAWLTELTIQFPTVNINTLTVNQNTTVQGNLTVANALTSNTATIQQDLTVNRDLSVANKTESKYFNSTSDYRAKQNFKPLNIQAVELIKKIPLYSFQYKDSNQPSIGIIAQDVQDVNIDGFELVDNKEATGENFDYMSIHESKLIYILWKAIQEQQQEIEQLKQLIKG